MTEPNSSSATDSVLVVLETIEGGTFATTLHTAWREALGALMEAQRRYAKNPSAELTITLKVATVKEGQVAMEASVKSKLPKHAKSEQLAWVDDDLCLHEDNPRQGKLRGVSNDDRPLRSGKGGN